MSIRFSEILKELRKREQLTQEELASKLEISKSAISMYENGNRTPDFETLEMFADFFNVNLSYLIGDSERLLSPEITLSNHEKDLVIAYREKPNMQSAVDTLLGIPSDDTNNSTENIYPIKKTARNDSEKSIIADSENNLVEIPYVARSGERGTITKSEAELDEIFSRLTPDTSEQY